MENHKVKQYTGKRCRIILKNNYNYTTIIPTIDSDSFTIKDKFGNQVEVDCGFIAVIEVLGERR